jgi:hypothetical protein
MDERVSAHVPNKANLKKCLTLNTEMSEYLAYGTTEATI